MDTKSKQSYYGPFRKGYSKDPKLLNFTKAQKPLKIQFEGKGEVKGYDFTQIRQTNKAFLYEVSSGGSKHYEVFLKRINHRFACISYPTSKAFGIWAWTFMNLESAINKFNELNTD